MELDIMPYCDNCPFFNPKKMASNYYTVTGELYFTELPIKIRCKNHDICKRVERQIKGE